MLCEATEGGFDPLKHLSVPFAPRFAPELIDAASKQGEKEAAVLRAIAEGRYDRSWVARQVEKMMAI